MAPTVEGNRFLQLVENEANPTTGQDVEMASATKTTEPAAPDASPALAPAPLSKVSPASSAQKPSPAHKACVPSVGVTPLQFCLLVLTGMTGTALLVLGLTHMLQRPKQLPVADAAVIASPPWAPLSPPNPPPPPDVCLALTGRSNLRGDGIRRYCHDALTGVTDDPVATCNSFFITSCHEEPCVLPDDHDSLWPVAFCEYNATTSHCQTSYFHGCNTGSISKSVPTPPSPVPCQALVGRRNLRADGSRSWCYDALLHTTNNPRAACESAFLTMCNDEPCEHPTQGTDPWLVSLCEYDSTTGRCHSSTFIECEATWIFLPAPPPPPPMIPQPRPPPPSPCLPLIGRSNLRGDMRRRSCSDAISAHPRHPEAICLTSFITACDEEPCSIPHGEGGRWAVSFCEYDHTLQHCYSNHFVMCDEEWMYMLSPP